MKSYALAVLHERPGFDRKEKPMLGTTAASAPKDGDVLVSREPFGGYTVRQLPAEVQLSASSRDDGMSVARSFARRHAVDVWYGDGGGCQLLETYRSRAKAPGSRVPHRADRV